jgi:ADP-ribosylglycohydrolase
MLLQPNEIIDRAIGMAFGTAVGDAMGIPCENLTREQIAEIKMTLNQNDLLFVNVAGRNPYVPKEWPAGRWGDATQLSLAIMHAIAKYLFSGAEKLPLIISIADEHVKEWRDCTDGWGNGTKSAIERIAQGSSSYHNSGDLSTGNGVIMKLTPLAFFFNVCGDTVDDELIETVCRMTHTSTVTIATAFIYVYLCVFIFEHDWPSSYVERKTFLEYVHQLCVKYESKYNLVTEKDLLSIRIHRYLENIDKMNDELLIDVSHGGTFFCIDTLSMVVGLVATKRATFETLIKASEMGGDTNIVAAMIGALLGATQGQQVLDDRHAEFVYQSNYVRQVGKEFGQALVQHLHLLPDCPQTM